jgi:hypothetical protein
MTQVRSSVGTREAFERLRRANPVSRDGARERAASIGRRDLSGPVFSTDARAFATPRRRWFRSVLAVAVLVAAFVGVASAVGLQLPVVDFGSAEKAPPRVVEDFAGFDVGAPSGMAPGVIAGETRRIMTANFAGATHELWVAPTREGGFCELWTKSFGGCDRVGTVPLGVTRIYRGSSSPLSQGDGSLVALGGHASAAYVTDVEIRFADHTVARPTIIWVSRPIGAGFFAYDVPPEHRQPGHQVTAVVALDGNGNVVKEDTEDDASRGGPPPDAVVSDEKPIASTGTHAGVATLYSAPTGYSGRCAWLELAGRNVLFTPCVPHGYPFAPFALRFAPTAADVVLAGWAGDQVASVVVRYADGDEETVHPRDGFVLYRLPAAHLTPGHQVTTLLGEDSTGATLHELAVAPMAAANPCFGPLPLPSATVRTCR